MPQPVVAAVIQHDNCFLLCQRPSHKRHGDLWEFPGGKVHGGESVPEAVFRELAEELHVKPTSVGRVRLSVPDPDSEFVIQFVDVAIEGVPSPSEHQAIAWLDREALRDLSLAPADRVFVETVLLAEGS